jgi:alanine racemase
MGATRLAKRLVGAGVEMLAVYTPDEARALADAVGNVPILILMPVGTIDRMDPLYRHLTNGRIHLVLHGEDQLAQLADMSTRIGATVPMHVQVDTGLSRGGVMPDAAHALVQKVVATPRARLAGLMTHFASPCCDAEFTREQARLFRDFVERLKPVLKAAVAAAAGSRAGASVVAPNELMLHAANSCAMFRARSYHGTMVRVGQALLGYALEDAPEPSAFEFAEYAARLEPCVRWTSTIAHVAEIPAGWPVGYGGTWRAPWRPDGRKTRIAIVPVGYADGYPRSLGGRGSGGPGWVAITGRRWDRRVGGGEGEPEPQGPATGEAGVAWAPVVGRVSMDQITIDVTDVPEAYLAGAGLADGGPEVELYGRDRGARNFVSTLAAGAGTITHDVLTRVGPRVERMYRYPASAAGQHAPMVVTTRANESGSGGGSGRAAEGPMRAVTGSATGPTGSEALGMAAYRVAGQG